MTPRRAAWLRIVHGLTTKLGRPPCANEVAVERGTKRHTELANAGYAAGAGEVIIGHRSSMTAPRSIRVAPVALVELGIPVIAYAAWSIGRDPHPDDVRASWSEISAALRGLDLVAISPWSGLQERSPGWSETLMEASRQVAMRCDVAVCVGDQILPGRVDVAAARAAGIPVALVSYRDLIALQSASVLWRPPYLVP